MIKSSGHRIYNQLREDPNFTVFSYNILRDMIANVVDILAKKLPQDINFNSSKLESVIHKIKLVPISKNIIEEPTYAYTTRENEFGDLEEVKEVV
jgi:hypothetical protein